jgi:hypothetical protein
MTVGDMTRDVLIRDVTKRWVATRHVVGVVGDVDRAMAREAVSEVVDALQANPAWARLLGIDTRR